MLRYVEQIVRDRFEQGVAAVSADLVADAERLLRDDL